MRSHLAERVEMRGTELICVHFLDSSDLMRHIVNLDLGKEAHGSFHFLWGLGGGMEREHACMNGHMEQTENGHIGLDCSWGIFHPYRQQPSMQGAEI